MRYRDNNIRTEEWDRCIKITMPLSTSSSGECTKINRFPITGSQPDNVLADEFSNFPLGDDGVVHVKSSILPLHWAVDIQRIAQPVVRRPATHKHIQVGLTSCFTSHSTQKRPIQGRSSRPGGATGRVLDLRSTGRGFKYYPGNHHLLAPSNVISKLIYLPSPASPFSHPATRACLNLCAIQIL